MLFATFRACIKLRINLISNYYSTIRKMEIETALVEPVFLIEKTEAYGKLSFELLKLRALDKTANVSATIISRVFLAIALSLFVIMLNIAIALWLGALLGKNYYGFFIVASCYGIIAIILLFTHSIIKTHINDSIITEMFS